MWESESFEKVAHVADKTFYSPVVFSLLAYATQQAVKSFWYELCNFNLIDIDLLKCLNCI